MKVFIKLILLIFIMTLSSCYNKVEFRGNNKYPSPKEDRLAPVAIIINLYFNDDIFFLKKVANDESVMAMKNKIKSDIETKMKRPVVYFDYKSEAQVKKIKTKFDKTLMINVKISKDINYTGLLDVSSLFSPIPAPEWGSYIFDISLEITSEKNKLSQKFSYYIESDFSYLFFPLYRNQPEKLAIERGFSKFLYEILYNEDLITLIENKDSKSFDYYFNYIVEEEDNKLVQRDTYSDFPIAIDFRTSWGTSEINAYYKDAEGNDVLGASSDEGTLVEYHLQSSTFKPTTKFILSPTLGYYYQDIIIKDFGRDTRDENEGTPGYIPGKVEERDSEGRLIISENVYSLDYQSQFSSTYIGGKIGLNLIYGDDIHFIFSPLLYFSLIEARHTTIIADDNEFSDWTFPFLGMVGVNLETGLFFNQLGLGLKLGYDYAYFRRFDFEHKIKFNSVIRSEEGILKSKKIEVDRFDVFSHKFFIDVFVIF